MKLNNAKQYCVPLAWKIRKLDNKQTLAIKGGPFNFKCLYSTNKIPEKKHLKVSKHRQNKSNAYRSTPITEQIRCPMKQKTGLVTERIKDGKENKANVEIEDIISAQKFYRTAQANRKIKVEVKKLLKNSKEKLVVKSDHTRRNKNSILFKHVIK